MQGGTCSGQKEPPLQKRRWCKRAALCPSRLPPDSKRTGCSASRVALPSAPAAAIAHQKTLHRRQGPAISDRAACEDRRFAQSGSFGV
jgi:hypothetical protein